MTSKQHIPNGTMLSGIHLLYRKLYLPYDLPSVDDIYTLVGFTLDLTSLHIEDVAARCAIDNTLAVNGRRLFGPEFNGAAVAALVFTQ